MKSLLKVPSAVLFLMAASFADISVSAPQNGATVGSTVEVAASDPNAATIQVYVDNGLAYQGDGSQVDTNLNLAPGTHLIVVQSWDAFGNITKAPLTVNSAAADGAAQAQPAGNAYTDIDQMPGWDSCTVCAGQDGNGPAAPYSTTQGQNSPSLDGASQQFWLGGDTPYSGALWWKQLTPQDSATHLTYDLNFYYDNADAAQALEFDVNQTTGGAKYIFGTQCNIRGEGQWDVWDTAGHQWVATGIPCGAPPTSTWNHLTEEFVRNPDGSMTFVSITLNGVKQYPNMTFWPLPQDGSELNVAFQMDGNYAETNYSVWLDKVNLYYW